jgi:hypothetical protein
MNHLGSVGVRVGEESSVLVKKTLKALKILEGSFHMSVLA